MVLLELFNGCHDNPISNRLVVWCILLDFFRVAFLQLKIMDSSQRVLSQIDPTQIENTDILPRKPL